MVTLLLLVFRAKNTTMRRAGRPNHLPGTFQAPISNRHSMQLEIAVTYTKQSPEPFSNRHKFGPFSSLFSALRGVGYPACGLKSAPIPAVNDRLRDSRFPYPLTVSYAAAPNPNSAPRETDLMTSTIARTLRSALCCAAAALALSAAPVSMAQRQAPPPEEKHAWSDATLSPDARADMVLKEMTLEEKIGLLHGQGMRGWGTPKANDWMGNGGAGWVLGIPRLGIPTIQMSDAAYGVRSSGTNGRYSTALPSNVASASSVGYRCRLRLRHLDRQRTSRPGLQHDTRRRREPHPRTAQRPHL